nr:monothiol glutaredoxin-S17-like [Quercus suber]
MEKEFCDFYTKFPHGYFLLVNAEEQPEICQAYSISSIPYFVYFEDGKVAGSLNPGEHAAPALELIEEDADALKERLQQLINSHPIMLFMEGTPGEPKSENSKWIVDILRDEDVIFGSFDIEADKEVCEGLKKFSAWPTFVDFVFIYTQAGIFNSGFDDVGDHQIQMVREEMIAVDNWYPRLYCKGQLFGGYRLVSRLHEKGELQQALKDHGIDTYASNEARVSELGSGKGGISILNTWIKSPMNSSRRSILISWIKSLISSNRVMLFMKGKPDEVKFGTFDILSNTEVFEGLNFLSDCSSYPQLYIGRRLIGGVSWSAMQMCGRMVLQEVIGPSNLHVTLYMNGKPQRPRTAYSNRVVKALQENGVKFQFRNVISRSIRRSMTEIPTTWPPFPLLYCGSMPTADYHEIMRLHEDGDLKSLISYYVWDFCENNYMNLDMDGNIRGHWYDRL